MSYYFPPVDGKDNLFTKFSQGLNVDIASVTEIKQLSDQGYDILLSKSILFLDLLDASAINTLLEAIVANTPVIISRLPAVEEYLGSGYPLYFNDMSEIVLTDDLITAAHQYLCRVDKEKFRIDTFVDSVVSFVDGTIAQL